MKKILVGINRNLTLEKEHLLAVRRTNPAKALAAERRELLANIRRAIATQNLSLITAVEKNIVEYDLVHHANSHAMVASHHARLANLDKSRLDEDEKHIVDARKAAMDVAQKLYIAQQMDALGVEPTDER